MSDFSSRYLVPTFNGLIAQIGLSTGVVVLCLAVFEWNRRKKTLQYLYAPRCRLRLNPSPPVSMAFLGWIIPTIKLPEEFYVSHAGLDAVMFLRFLRMCLHFCLFIGIIAGVILFPIHYTGKSGLTEVERMSIANIDNDDSNILWTHVVLTYVVTISWMFLLFKNYWQWMDLRREYTLQRIRQGEIAERSIFISRLPSQLRTDADLKDFFESLKMGPVESATVVKHCGRLSQKIDRRENALNLLEKNHIELAREVLDSIQYGPGLLHPSAPSTKQPTTAAVTAAYAETAAGQSVDAATLESTVQDLYRNKKRYRKTRKSIFAHKKDAPPQPHLNIPLSALSQHSDMIDVYVQGKERKEDQDHHQADSTLSSDLPSTSIWKILAGLDRRVLDPFQPTRLVKRFKGGNRVDSIDYLMKKYNRLDRKVAELRDGSPRFKPTSFGFVTFKHHLSAQLCAQARVDSRPQGMSVQLAMEPRDVLWSNLTSSFRNRFSRTVIVNLSIWLVTIFWIFPTSAFLFLTSLKALSEKFEFLQPILDTSPLLQSLLQNVLPIVFVSIFLALAPVIILEITKQELPVSYSALEEKVFRRYYHFLIFNVLFVFMIGRTIITSIIQLIQEPTNVFTMLAKFLPLGSTFFLFYIVFNTCTHALELVQIWAQLIVHAFVTARKLTPTPRSLQRATTPWAFQYYYYYPQNILAIVITLIYSLLNPLILIAACIYFGFALLVFKYQFAYCYVRKYEMSGKYFRHVFQYTTDGLIIFQITITGILWLKGAVVGGFVVVALMGFTVYFKIMCGDLFKSRTKFLPLDTGLRNFDNESTYNMNEIPTFPGAESARSSALMDNGLRKRHATNKDDETRVDLNGGSVILDRGLWNSSTLPDQSRVETSEIKSLSLPLDHQDQEGYYAASGEKLQEISGTKNNSRNSMGLRIHIKDPSNEPATSSRRNSTREFKLFTVGDNPLEGPEEDESSPNTDDMDDGFEHVDEIVHSPTGFMDEEGFFLDGYGFRNTGMACQLLASHFEHTPSRLIYQDNTSDFETYVHPALLRPLNRKLWLPRNPLYAHWDLDDTVEVDFALNSSATMGKLELRIKDKEKSLHSPLVAQHQSLDQQYDDQCKSTGGSNFENSIGLHSPSNWQGCFSDSPPSTPGAMTELPGSNWEKFEERKRSLAAEEAGSGIGSVDGPASSFRTHSRKNSRNLNNDFMVAASNGGRATPLRSMTTATASHSASMNNMRKFSPSSPRAAPAFLAPPRQLTAEDLGVAANGQNGTRPKRSASTPPAPIPLEGSAVEGSAADAKHNGSTAGLSSRFLPAHLGVRHPQRGSSPALHAQYQQQQQSGNQSPRVLFAQDTTPRAMKLLGPLHRHTISHGQGNNAFQGPGHSSGVIPPVPTLGTGAGATGSLGPAAGAMTAAAVTNPNTTGAGGATSHDTLPRKNGAVRGAAGTFFAMMFGGPHDDDDEVLEKNENPHFGYETGGIWNRRRGSINDDDDDDDDDEDEDCSFGQAHLEEVVTLPDAGLAALIPATTGVAAAALTAGSTPFMTTATSEGSQAAASTSVDDPTGTRVDAGTGTNAAGVGSG